jgi:hypothetical protein
MGLVKTLWTGRGWTIFISELECVGKLTPAFALETLNVFVNYIQITAIHEVVANFDNDDPAYSYLMCWGMLVGQVLGVTLSAYLWVRENYLLHNPVRMTMSAIVSYI